MEKTVYVITYVIAGAPWTTVADSDIKRDMAIVMLDAKDLAYSITAVTAVVDLSRSTDDAILNILASICA